MIPLTFSLNLLTAPLIVFWSLVTLPSESLIHLFSVLRLSAQTLMQDFLNQLLLSLAVSYS